MKSLKTYLLVLVMVTGLICASPVNVLATTNVPTIPAETVYSENGITIATSKIEYDNSWRYYFVDAVISNNSSMDVNYEIEYIIINGFQIQTFTFGDVYSGMSADVEIAINPDSLSLAKIEHMMDIEVCFRLSESDDYNNIIDTPVIKIATSDAGKYKQSYEFEGQEVYNAGGIRILARLGESNEYFPVLLFVENNSGKTVSFMYEDVAINNKMVSEMMTGGRVVSSAIQVIEMDRDLLTMWIDDIPQNKDISAIDFKLSFMPIENDGSFSTGNMYLSDRITLTR